MRRITIPAAVCTVAAILGLMSISTAADSDEAEIRAAVESYFDGMMSHDAEALDRAFHPESRLLGSPREGLTVIPFREWRTFAEREAPERDLARYDNRIVSVDAYGKAAVVKVDLAWPDVHYVDYLSLLEIDGEWKIVNKIWHQEAPDAVASSGE